jgi:hypothetical protein
MRFGKTVVVSPFLIDGRIQQIVLLKQRDQKVIPPIGPGGPVTIVGTGEEFYSLAGYGPTTLDAAGIADTFVFDKIELGSKLDLVAAGNFALHLLPTGTLADFVFNDEGTAEEAVVSTVSDLALGLGAVAKVAGTGRTALVLARGAAAANAGVGAWRGGEAIVYAYQEDYVKAAGAAGEDY